MNDRIVSQCLWLADVNTVVTRLIMLLVMGLLVHYSHKAHVSFTDEWIKNHEEFFIAECCAR